MAIDEKAVFVAALGLSDAQEREAYLQEACAGDPALVDRLRELLSAHDESHGPLDRRPPALGVTVDTTAREGPGTVIGPYKLLQQIGEGGMGTVFMAEQTQPVQRKVALKIIRPGMDSCSVIARFEAERQALALMDHPNIARVFDAGTTVSGRPYFVMELVKGIPITRYCDEHHLTPKQRLELFVPICHAIQHAHQKGIIHRDLKPSNVLVADYDDRPVPKVIDFGVAKATGSKLTEHTLFTEFGQIVGTLEYMSPEQAKLNSLDIDTRSDIYALGVLLYELLTGTTPFDRKRFSQAAFDEVLRIIREEEPPKPSTRLSESKDSLPSISALRQTEPAKLTKLVKGELDWIVMKCLEKDRNRRYESANGLATDVQRYLSGEAVLAHPPSAGYRLRKFARRNRGPVLAGGLLFLALAAGVIGTAIGLARAAAAAEAAREANEQAQKRLRQIERQSEILLSIFDDLNPHSDEKLGKPLFAILGERFGKAALQLEGEEVGDPLLVARLQDRLGQSLIHFGMADQAVSLCAKALASREAVLGSDHPETLSSMNSLAAAYQEAGKPGLAVPLHEHALRLNKTIQGPDHPDTLTTMNNLALAYHRVGKLDLAVPLYEETVKLRKAKLGADHHKTLVSMNNLARAYQDKGKLELAVPLLEETLRLRQATRGADHPDTLLSMVVLALAYHRQGKLHLALPLFEETFRVRKAKLGPDHPETLTSMNGLARVYQDQGKLDLALSLFEECLRLRRAKLGPDHPDTWNSMNNLAVFYASSGKVDQAVPLYEETVRLRRAKLGADHPDTLTSLNNLGKSYLAIGKHDLAAALLREAARGIEKRHFEHVWADRVTHNLIACLEQLKQFEEAEAWRRKWLVVLQQKGADGSPAYATELAALGSNLIQQNKPKEAEPLLREALAVRRQKDPQAWTTFATKALLGASLLCQQKYADAEPFLSEGYEGMRKQAIQLTPAGKSDMQEALQRLVQLYEAWGKKAKAAKWRDVLEARQKESKAGTPEAGKRP